MHTAVNRENTLTKYAFSGPRSKLMGYGYNTWAETESAKNLTRKQHAKWHRPCRYKVERLEARMMKQWLAMEHYRLHVIEEWPNSPAKDAALASARSCIEGLARGMSPSSLNQCDVCAARMQRAVLEMPLRKAA